MSVIKRESFYFKFGMKDDFVFSFLGGGGGEVRRRGYKTKIHNFSTEIEMLKTIQLDVFLPPIISKHKPVHTSRGIY